MDAGMHEETTNEIAPTTICHIEFTLNGLPQAIDVESRMLVVDVLRGELGLTGTHIGCEQGVCGACTVLIDGRSARSCLMLAPQLHGREVLTIEGVASASGRLHPIQRALVDGRGMQCGFCTPGIVMSSYEAERTGKTFRTRDDVSSVVSGHLCRCTGYESIVDALSNHFLNGST